MYWKALIGFALAVAVAYVQGASLRHAAMTDEFLPANARAMGAMGHEVETFDTLSDVARTLKKGNRRTKGKSTAATVLKESDDQLVFGIPKSKIDDTCTKIRNMPKKGAFSTCEVDPFFNAMMNQNGRECLSLDRTVCVETQGCMWVANLFGGKSSDQSQSCVPDPCYRLNNGKCTIQHTGGRCVWYTKSQNKKIHKKSHAGCYQSPCNNPLENNAKGCAESSNEFYKCVWCGKNYGCQNMETESYAQCWNIGQENDRCNNCMVKGKKGEPSANAPCKRDECYKECCMSPFCLCNKDLLKSSEEVALDLEASPPGDDDA